MTEDFEETGVIYFLKALFGLVVILGVLAIVRISGYMEKYSNSLTIWEKTSLKKAFRSSQKDNHE